MAKVVRNRFAAPPIDEGPQVANSAHDSQGVGVLGWLAANWPAVYLRLANAPAARYARARDYKDRTYAIKKPSRSGRLP